MNAILSLILSLFSVMGGPTCVAVPWSAEAVCAAPEDATDPAPEGRAQKEDTRRRTAMDASGTDVDTASASSTGDAISNGF